MKSTNKAKALIMEKISNIPEHIATINIANKIRNTNLSRKQGLMPLFELVSNSIHSIKERKDCGLMEKADLGNIKITLIRNGRPETMESIKDNDTYPIVNIIVTDNGIGLNDENLRSFTEADSDHKLNIGGKGIGRFVCLKAFKWLSIDSIYKDSNVFKRRKIELRNTKEGFGNYEEPTTQTDEFCTTSTLYTFDPAFEKHTPRRLEDVASALITHFQLYYIMGNAPHISIRNQNNIFIDLDNLYIRSFANKVQKGTFKIGDNEFEVYLSQTNSSKSHRLHFCAHYRTVIEEWMGKNIIELGKNSIPNKDAQNFYYAAFVVGDILDESVNNERTSFLFPTNEDEDDEDSIDITLPKIRKKAISVIEDLISDYIDTVRTKKIETYRTIIDNEFPQYRILLNRKEDKVKKLAAGLSNHELDVELYKIEAEWRTEIKELGSEILEQKKDITSLEEYHNLYENYISGLNEIGQAELARYITHRKSIIDLLDFLTSTDNEKKKYSNEDLVHNIFFPIRTTSDNIPYDKQNLWLLDERLAYHSYLSSDKMFSAIENVQVSENEEDRPDLLILSNAFAFATDKDAPYSSITIVEFKKPERDNYVDNDDKKNPLDQVERYVEDLLSGSIRNRKGRTINISKETPFYIYIVCDLSPSLIRILERREFTKTPDGLGYYTFKNKRYNGYIEVISFEKVKSDAKKRNQILFDKLGLPNE